MLKNSSTNRRHFTCKNRHGLQQVFEEAQTVYACGAWADMSQRQQSQEKIRQRRAGSLFHVNPHLFIAILGIHLKVVQGIHQIL